MVSNAVSPLYLGHDLSQTSERATRPERPARLLRSATATHVRKDSSSLLRSIAHGKICKQKSQQKRELPQQARTLRRAEAQLVPRSRRVRPDQYARAVSLFEKLKTLRLACPIPQLGPCEAESSVIVLQYPKHCFWPLKDRIHLAGDRGADILTRHEVQILVRDLIHDIKRLYDARIPYKVDISNTLIAHMSSRRRGYMAYRPFIDTFDLDIDPQDESISWAGLKESVLHSARAQYAVIEALAESSSIQPALDLPADLEPDAVVQVFEASDPPLVQRNAVLRRVPNYSSRLGRFVINRAQKYLHVLPCRTTAVSSWTEAYCQNFVDSIAHLLQLADMPTATTEDQTTHVADRAGLLVAYNSYLVHLYAKTIEGNRSRGILAPETESPEMYAEMEHFRLVTDARRKLAEAVDALRAVGLTLDPRAEWFLEGSPILSRAGAG
ncbi:hypothetical protein F4802DRAFT_592453 [Xylaria palmicola]|nr:hypothetical protein F4802DRAFT_592453 [Xylaria palmicola]